MARFTRRSYRRRKLFVGIALFSSVALISTGFASWIISLNAKGEIGGDVTVGTVTDSSVTIEINREYEDEEKDFYDDIDDMEDDGQDEDLKDLVIVDEGFEDESNL